MIGEVRALDALLRRAGATPADFAEGGPDGQELHEMVTATDDVWAAFRQHITAPTATLLGLLILWQVTPNGDGEHDVTEYYLARRS